MEHNDSNGLNFIKARKRLISIIENDVLKEYSSSFRKAPQLSFRQCIYLFILPCLAFAMNIRGNSFNLGRNINNKTIDGSYQVWMDCNNNIILVGSILLVFIIMNIVLSI